MAILLRTLGTESYTSARVLVVDPHGEYSSALPGHSRVITSGTEEGADAFRVPYWALPFDELMSIAMGQIPERDGEHIRERVRELKTQAAEHLAVRPPTQAITADSPIPFSIRRLWFELEDAERATFSQRDQTEDTLEERTADGDAERLIAPEYPAATPYNTPPYYNSARRGIRRQLDFMRARLLDSRFRFMFDPSDAWHPSQDGEVRADLDALLAGWVGGPEPVTILDVSGLPSEVLDAVVGTNAGDITYSALFWGMELPVGGKQQPLLVVLDEAHRFLPAGADTSATRACLRIAREGRKYGVGLMTVTQRPSDVDPGVLSQCGTMIALRVTNGADRAAVAATVPDDLGGLTAMLPSLRTGEALVLGDALQVPSRVRIQKAPSRPVGDDPRLPEAWEQPRPDPAGYGEAVARWRGQSTSQSDRTVGRP